MITLSPSLLVDALGCTQERASLFAGPLQRACTRYQINATPKRLSAFLAQIGHESGALRYTSELWGPTPAQSRYEGRADLGNTEPGDGFRYRGRGLIQTTGRANYRELTRRLRADGWDCPDFERDPDALATDPLWAAISAADYWDSRGLNAIADRGDFARVTIKINGGLNGQAERLKRLDMARAAVDRAASAIRAPHEQPTPAAPAPQQEKATMPLPLAPLLIPLAESLIEAFTPLAKEKLTKEIARHSDKPEVAEQIAAGVIEAAKLATGAADPIQAVAEVRADPAAMERTEAAAMASVDQLLPLIERINAMEQGNIRAARDFNAAEPMMIDTPWLRMKFIHALSLAFVSFAAWFVVETWDSLTPELRGAVITLMVIAGWNGVRDYWMGSSSGSNEKTAMLTRAGKG